MCWVVACSYNRITAMAMVETINTLKEFIAVNKNKVFSDVIVYFQG